MTPVIVVIERLLHKIGLIPLASYERLLLRNAYNQGQRVRLMLLVMELEAAYKKATGKTYVKRKTK